MQPLHVETIYPLELVRQVISHYLNGETDDTYSFELTAEPGAEMMIIQGDPPLLKRALDNLIGNAIKHNPDGCGITVQIKRHHNLCQIYIADDGAGMTDEQLKTLNQGIFPKKEYQATGETAHGLGHPFALQPFVLSGESLSLSACWGVPQSPGRVLTHL